MPNSARAPVQWRAWGDQRRTQVMPTPQRDSLRVSKKLSPTQPGALKLARKYGGDLLCVRYRLDADGSHGYTTVELIVDRAPVVKRADRIVGIRIGYAETALRGTVRASGAKWDQPAKLWRLPYRVALRLGLRERIVEK
jgi:hypothetical protein